MSIKTSKAMLLLSVILLLYIILIEVVVLSYFVNDNVAVINKWDESPVEISVHTESSVFRTDVRREVSNIEKKAGNTKIEYSERGHIHIIDGKTNSLSRVFNKIYEGEFGSDVFQEYVGDDGFTMSATQRNPCFTFSVYDPRSYSPKKSEETPPHFKVVMIGNSVSEDEYRACLGEEISHALYFIKDRHLYFNESIFNSNVINRSRVELTWLDRVLIKSLSSKKISRGMSRWSYRLALYRNIYKWLF